MEYVEKPLSAFDQIFLDMSRDTDLAGLVRNFGPLPAVLGRETSDRLHSELGWLQPRKNASPIRALAHCLCGL